ncbi:hypothetical protein BDN70DRAFT_862258 [Pholiota conissans]|uniref:BTB domain-containing protein n=1 Tax=Pholiota conissans TaxID=109636 RepID=A0A9P6CYB6_9AGAR|nr:hypothetical protein BDN70DRAFT_862258 [Pholiota conissans]
MDLPTVRPCPVRDCTLPIDIILKSSDDIFHAAHTKLLEQFSEGFPHAASVTVDANIPVLEETSAVLDLMLQFMHHTRQPDLGNIDFDLLCSFAEAVEKYLIYSAMSVCKILMNLSIAYHPVEVLVYALKHDYHELANTAAPLTVQNDSEMVVSKAKAAGIHDSFLVAWFRYRDNVTKAGRSLLKNPPGYGIGGLHKGGLQQCELWTEFIEEVLSAGIKLDFPKPKDVAEIISNHVEDLEECPHCSKRGNYWLAHAQSAAKEEYPLFLKF